MSPFLKLAIRAAREAGTLLRESAGTELVVNDATDHDIKLEMDVRAQKLIEGLILSSFPGHAIYGEEGLAGNQDSEFHWIVDPIDGTVNYFYGIPHYCVSIALRRKEEMIAGVIFDPNIGADGEIYTWETGTPAFLNGRAIRPSNRSKPGEAIMTIGFSKTAETIDKGLGLMRELLPAIRKSRIMGSATLGLAYVACGRLDAYIEHQLSLWDVAAGVPMVEAGGGKVILIPSTEDPDKLRLLAYNGKLPLEEPGILRDFLQT